MDRMFSTIADFSDPRVGGGDSFCDRLSSRYTVYLLVVFALLVSSRQYMISPISCWAPDHFTDNQVDYVNQICWVRNTYYLPWGLPIPAPGMPRKKIGYYQWVGLILAIQAAMFYTPRALWGLFNRKSGMSVSTITDAALDCQKNTDPDARDKTLRYMVKHMGRFLREVSRKYHLYSKWKVVWWRIYGNYLAWLYILVKFIYIGNIIAQIFLLNHFLGTPYHLYGWTVLKRLSQGLEISESHRFPRVTMCDFTIRLLGNNHRYTVQCALAVNLFNEKIFIFVWFWFVFVAVASSVSCVMWIFRAVYIPHQMTYIKSRLIALGKVRESDTTAPIQDFVQRYLRRDGIFIVRLVGKNASDIIAAELLCGLWDHFLDNRLILERLESQESARRMSFSVPMHPEKSRGEEEGKRLNLQPT